MITRMESLINRRNELEDECSFDGEDICGRVCGEGILLCDTIKSGNYRISHESKELSFKVDDAEKLYRFLGKMLEELK